MKPAGDHERLARAFAVPVARTRLAVATTAGAALVAMFTPIGLVVAGGLVAGFGGVALRGRVSVTKALREVDAWGFPVEGYRAWLLADEPAFDVELARDVESEVLVTSVRAIDDSIQVERRGERTFRVITRRIALPSSKKDGSLLFVGDRRLLHELRARVLAPLHADVGVLRMRMGDRATLRAVPAALPAALEAPSESPGGGAFRESAMVAPPALQALVRDGGDRELPREARRLKHRDRRVVYATGSAPHGAGTVIAFTLGGLTSGAGWFDLIGSGIGAVAGGVMGVVAAVQGNRRNARRIAMSVDGHGFPIDGFADWLLSGRPLLDIELRTPIDRSWLRSLLDRLPRAFSVSVNAEVPWVEDVVWLDEHRVRIETRPTLIEPPSRIEPFYGGSHAMFGTFVEQVLGPLHEQAGIEAVRMGGYVDRRV